MAIDVELIRQTLQGDKRAFASLVEKYQPQILALCQRMVKNPQDAEELTQDTFLCAYQKLGQLRDGEKFPLWLKQIARNRCKMFLRRETGCDQQQPNDDCALNGNSRMECQTPGVFRQLR